MHNGSGMANVARSCVEGEKKLGIDSVLANTFDESLWGNTLDADVHVSHTHIPRLAKARFTKKPKIVGVFHGTPEHVFQGSVEVAENGRYAPSNSFMIMQHDLQRSDARVTFWPRHQAIYQQMVDWGTTVHCVPLGVERKFWEAGVSRGKYQGKPSVWTGENAHYIKWPLDLFLLWPWVAAELPEVQLHACYLPWDVHRFFFPLAYRTGAYYTAHIGPWTYPHEELRHIFKSIDFFIGLVRYGDFNRIALEANATKGPKTISYAGNPYSDFWLPEGDQRVVAKELLRILRGEVKPRAKTEVPDLEETSRAMQAIYKSILVKDAVRGVGSGKKTKGGRRG